MTCSTEITVICAGWLLCDVYGFDVCTGVSRVYRRGVQLGLIDFPAYSAKTSCVGRVRARRLQVVPRRAVHAIVHWRRDWRRSDCALIVRVANLAPAESAATFRVHFIGYTIITITCRRGRRVGVSSVGPSRLRRDQDGAKRKARRFQHASGSAAARLLNSRHDDVVDVRPHECETCRRKSRTYSRASQTTDDRARRGPYLSRDRTIHDGS